MSLITSEQIKQFHEQGFFVTQRMFEREQLGEMEREFDRLAEEFVRQAEESGDARTIEIARLRPFIGGAHLISAACAAFVKAPIYVEACKTFIGPDADLYFNQAVLKPPEKGESFGWHQDSGYMATEPLEYITCWTAISDSTLENGCIWVLPGSHKRGLLPHEWSEQTNSRDVAVEDESSAIPVEMKAGQVAVFSSFTLHKSGPNTSQSVRRGYVPQYHQPGVVEAESGELFGDQFPVLRGGQPCA